MRQLITLSLILALTGFHGTARAGPADDILAGSGCQGGLIVHVGCGDGKLTAALQASDRYLVHGLDADPRNVQAARRHVGSLGQHGKVSIDRFDGEHLPFADGLVNLLVVDAASDVSAAEMTRVLCPRGVAYVKSADAWTKTVKPWPDSMDEWSHFLHDASGNAVAHDSQVGPPKRLRWIGGPLWSRSHEYDSGLAAMVTSRGRLFYIFDEGPTGITDPRIPDQWTLTARDAFNGVVLWKREIPDWGWKAWKRAEMEAADWSRMRSQRLRLPVAVPRRLVSTDDRVYVTLGYRAPVSALDAATGQTLMTYADTERTDEIVHHDGRLVLCIRSEPKTPALEVGLEGLSRQPVEPASLVALEAATGRRLWQTEPGTVAPLSLTANGANVFYHNQNEVVCLDAATGKPRWHAPTVAVFASNWNTDTTLVAYQDVVLCANRKQLVGLSAVDGKLLWTLPGARGFGIGNPPDLFVADGLVWYGRGRSEVPTITGHDPRTGEPARTIEMGGVITHGHHARCYRSRATDDYLLLPKRAVEFIDLDGSDHVRNNWVRGACRYGVLPANGLLYGTPHPCFCYAGVKLNGFLGLSASAVTFSSREKTPRVERGPAYEDPLNANAFETTDDDWPMYRHDPTRSGSTSSRIDARVRPVWKTAIDGKLTPPVVADGRLFTARGNAGQVRALDADTGQPIWDYVTGGRVDSSPTYYRGRLIFGSADGYVYCLRASDGALAWRFRAAPDERSVVAFGQVESAWPVHGSVLILDDTVYFTAGRSSFLDGGITLYGIDPVTGEKRYETRLDGPREDMKPLDEAAYAMEGSKSDILVTDGTLIYLFHNVFDTRLQKQPTPILGEPGVRNLGTRNFGLHLFSNAGFLDASGFNRSYWMLGDRWPAFNFAHQSPQAGQLVVFDETHTYAAKCFLRRNVLSPQFFPATDGYYLVADRRENRPVLIASDGKGGPPFMRWLPQTGDLQTCWNLGVGFARGEPAQWTNVVPVRIRAMVHTPGVLFTAGPPDVCDPNDPTAALEGRKGAVLSAFQPADGKKLFETKLDSPPVFDGMIATVGRLYFTTRDGYVHCFSDDSQ